MEDYQREAVVNCFINSNVVFEPLDVTNNLLESAILDDDEVMKISSESVQGARVQLFVAFVKRKAGYTFEKLTTALKLCGKYGQLVKDLERSALFLQRYNTKVKELVRCSSSRENFMYLDMLMSIADSLNNNDSLEICKYMSLSDDCIASVEASKIPGLATMNFCRKTRIVKVSNVQAFRNVLSSLSFVHQLAIVDRYMKALEYQELELEVTKTEPDILLETVKEIFQDRMTRFKVAKKICNMFLKEYNRTLLADLEVDNCVLTLKVPTRTALNSLHRDICSEILACKVLKLMFPYVQDLDYTADIRKSKITLELNEHIYQISKSYFDETLKLQFQDDAPDDHDYGATKIGSVPYLPGALGPGTSGASIGTWKAFEKDSSIMTINQEKLEPQMQDDAPKNRAYVGAFGPEITVTITRSFPDTLLSLLRSAINDKKNLHTIGRPLRNFFCQCFEDIICTKIRDGSYGVSFVLQVATVSALHRLHTAISNGKLAGDILAKVQNTIGGSRVRCARICVELDKDDYSNAEKYFETSKISIRPFEDDSRPITTSQGTPSSPLYLDQESFDMVQQMYQERQDYEKTLSKSSTFGKK